MPRMDGTGPAGQGPGTGRRMGYCGTPGSRAQQAVSNQSNGWLKITLGVLGALIGGAYGLSRQGGRNGSRTRNGSVGKHGRM